MRKAGWGGIISAAMMIVTGTDARAAAEAAAPQDSAAGLDDIVVTARRIEENAQDIPLAVTALSSAALERNSVREIRDLSASVPNLNIQTGNNNPASVVFSIRGQSQSNSSLLGVDSAVGVYIDGLNVPRNDGLRNGLVDIQRVEVLRGPQGTLYGRNTTGGAVSIITKDPGKDVGGSVQASYGNYNAWSLLGVLSIPVADGVGLRFVAQHGERDGVGSQPGFGKHLLSENQEYFRGKLKIEKGDFTASVMADYFSFTSGGAIVKLAGLTPATATAPEGGNATRQVALQLGLNPAVNADLAVAAAALKADIWRGGFYDTVADAPLGGTSKGQSVVANLEWKASDNLTLRSISGYRGFKRRSLLDTDGSSYAINASDNNTKHDAFYSEEFQLLGGGSVFNWVAGLYYSYETGKDFTQSQALPLISNFSVTTADGKITSSSYAVFGQANWNFADRWSLTLGGRWTKETKEILNRNRTTTGCGVPVSLRDDGVTCLGTFKKSFSDPSWLASIDYKLSEDSLLYAKVSRGFRGGGQNQRALNSIPAFASFAPETVTEYEVGLKSELFDRRLRLNLAGYYDDYTDVQRTIVVSINNASVSIVSNAASARLAGFEGEANLRVTDGLFLNGSVGYLNAKYKDFSDFTGDRSGEDWPAPDWNYSLGARYETATGMGPFSVSGIWAWQDDLNLSPTSKNKNQVIQRAYGTLSGRMALTIEQAGLEVALFGRNLTGKHFYTAGIGLESLGVNQLQAGEPRTFGIQITKKFGAQ